METTSKNFLGTKPLPTGANQCGFQVYPINCSKLSFKSDFFMRVTLYIDTINKTFWSTHIEVFYIKYLSYEF